MAGGVNAAISGGNIGQPMLVGGISEASEPIAATTYRTILLLN